MRRRQLIGFAIGNLVLGLGGCTYIQKPYEHRASGVIGTEEPIFECCPDWGERTETNDHLADGRIIQSEKADETVYWDKIADEYSMFADEFMFHSYNNKFLVVSAVFLPDRLTIVGSSSTFEDRRMVQTLKIAPRRAPRVGSAYINRFELWRAENQEPPTKLTIQKEYLDNPVGETVEQ